MAGWTNKFRTPPIPDGVTVFQVNTKDDGTMLGEWIQLKDGRYKCVNTFLKDANRSPQVAYGRTMTECRRSAEAARREGQA